MGGLAVPSQMSRYSHHSANVRSVPPRTALNVRHAVQFPCQMIENGTCSRRLVGRIPAQTVDSPRDGANLKRGRIGCSRAEFDSCLRGCSSISHKQEFAGHSAFSDAGSPRIVPLCPIDLQEAGHKAALLPDSHRWDTKLCRSCRLWKTSRLRPCLRRPAES